MHAIADVCAAPAERLRLGEILVASGTISQRQLEEALARKRLSGRRIGEELVAAGHLARDGLAPALKLQRRLVLAACLAALFAGRGAPDAEAAQAKGFMPVSVTVVETIGIRPVHQAQDLVVTPADVARGYVEAPAASRFEIHNRGPCLFEFTALADLFRRVRVTGPGAAGEFGAGGGAVLLNGGAGRTSDVSMSYRFDLAPGVQPGAYRWPLALSVLPM